MSFNSLVLTGVSGSGKSTIGRYLCENTIHFAQVTAITTRDPREDDRSGDYEYLTDSEFDVQREALIVFAEYRERRYGITRYHIDQIRKENKQPILIITPKSLAEYRSHITSCLGNPMTVFVDAPDSLLSDRLNLRDDSEQADKVMAQRNNDRQFSEHCNFQLNNVDLEESIRMILTWYGLN